MKHVDEEILKIKNITEEQGKASSGENEKDNEKVPVIYERREFLDGKITMEVPADSKEVSEETIQFVFYGANKPHYVIESESTEIAVGYNYTDMEISNDDIFRFATFAAKMLETMGPGVKIIKVKNHKRDYFNMSTVEFTSKGLDGGIYNLMFYVSIDDKLLISFVICPSKKAEELKEIAEHIVNSVELIITE